MNNKPFVLNNTFRKGIVFFSFILICFSCKEKKPIANSIDHPMYHDPAVKGFTENISKNPDNARLYYERGMMLRRLQEDTLALRDFKQAASLDSNKAEYWSAVGDLMFEHQDIDGSLPYLERAVKLNPKDPLARLKIAKLLIFLKDYKKAFNEINTVQRQNAMVPETYFLEGIIFKDTKDTTQALSRFLTAVQIDPSYKDAILQLGLLYSAKKDPQALKYFDNAYRIDTTDAFPLYAKGMYYQDQEKYEQAKAEYANCIVKDANYTDAYFGVGWILMQQDSLEKARRHFDIVTKLEPTNAEAYYNRGLCSELMDKPQDAVADYKQALVFNERYKEAQDGIKRLGGKK